MSLIDEEVKEKPAKLKATERFKRPAYQLEHCDVIGYLAKKYDIKGEMWCSLNRGNVDG